MKQRYQVSDEFKQECKRNVNQYEKIGKIHIIEDNVDITENDNLVDFSIDDNCYVDDKFIGTTIAKKITVNILNPDNEINLENKEISVETGMIINSIEETVPYGNYIIEKPEDEEVVEKTSFVGYDYMIKFNATYVDRVTYPCEVSVLFEDVCNQVGLEAGNIEFTNADYIILGNPFTNNEDCKTVLSNISQLAGGFAKIGRDNKVYIVSLSKENVVDDIDGNNYFTDFSKNNEWGEVNSLVLKVSDIEGENTALDNKESIEENGLTEVTIEDNYFLIDQEERENAIIPLWNTLKGIKYLPFKTQYYGYPYLDTGDMIYIQDAKDNKYVSYVFNHSFTYNGAFSGSIETKAMTKTQTAYKNMIDAKTKFKQAERKIDKINGVIEDVIQEQTQYDNKLTQITQDVDSIKQKVSNIADFTREQTAVNQIYIDDIAYGSGYMLDFIIYGNTELFNSNEITITASTKQRGYGEAICLTTESEEDILTEDEEQIAIGSKTFAIDYIKITLDDVLRSLTINEETYYDTLEISQDGIITVTRKIGVDDSGELYLLDEEIVTVLEEKFVLPSEEEVYYFVEEIYGLRYYAKYIIKNDYSDVFATKAELNTSITQTANEISIEVNEKIDETKSELNTKITQTASEISSEVSKKVDETKIISKINQSAEEVAIQANKISLQGYTTINGGFAIDENGNASIANETVKINEQGIQMADGAKIVGGNGIYTNLQFIAQGLLGYELALPSVNMATLDIYADIPENFVIENAYITIKHQPVVWNYSAESVSNQRGYARKIQVYTESLSGFKYIDYGSENTGTDISGTSTGTLGTSGKTFSSSSTEIVKSEDLSEYLSSGVLTIFRIGSTDGLSTITSSTIADILSKTGNGFAILNVFGYLSVSE